jgi:hypothetical protein
MHAALPGAFPTRSDISGSKLDTHTHHQLGRVVIYISIYSFRLTSWSSVRTSSIRESNSAAVRPRVDVNGHSPRDSSRSPIIWTRERAVSRISSTTTRIYVPRQNLCRGWLERDLYVTSQHCCGIEHRSKNGGTRLATVGDMIRDAVERPYLGTNHLYVAAPLRRQHLGIYYRATAASTDGLSLGHDPCLP